MSLSRKSRSIRPRSSWATLSRLSAAPISASIRSRRSSRSLIAATREGMSPPLAMASVRWAISASTTVRSAFSASRFDSPSVGRSWSMAFRIAASTTPGWRMSLSMVESTARFMRGSGIKRLFGQTVFPRKWLYPHL